MGMLQNSIFSNAKHPFFISLFYGNWLFYFYFFSSFQNQAFKELPLIRPKLSTFLDSEDNRKERGPLKRQIDIYGE